MKLINSLTYSESNEAEKRTKKCKNESYPQKIL